MTDTTAPPDSYAALGEHLNDVLARLRAVTIGDKPIILPGDIAFLEHMINELGALDHIINTLTYQSMATAGQAVHDRQRADFLQANNTDLLMRLRDSDAALELVTKLAETAGLKIGDALDG